MKNFSLLTVSLLALTFCVNAQSNWSLGLRSGLYMEKTYTGDENYVSPKFNQQLFLTKKLFKNLEAEINIAYTPSSRNTSTYYGSYDGSILNYLSTTQYSSQAIEMGLIARYFICKNNGWAPYGFIGITGTKNFSKQKTVSEAHLSGGGYIPEQTNIYTNNSITFVDEFIFGIGTNKRIATNWQVNTQFSLGYMASSAQSMVGGVDIIPKFQVGLAYSW